MARFARPVRTLASSRLNASIPLSRSACRLLTTSFTMLCDLLSPARQNSTFRARVESTSAGLRLRLLALLLLHDHRAQRLAEHHPPDIAGAGHVEHQDR